MKTKLTSQLVNEASRVLKNLGHPDRLRIIEQLEHKPLSVCELMEKLKLDQVTVSKHLAVLRQGGIVKNETQANYRYYSIAHPNALNILNCVRKHGGKTK